MRVSIPYDSQCVGVIKTRDSQGFWRCLIKSAKGDNAKNGSCEKQAWGLVLGESMLRFADALVAGGVVEALGLEAF